MIRAKLGDRVIVHFKNSLPEATTIHWHGLRVPNEMDGAPGVTQTADRARRQSSATSSCCRTPARTGITRTRSAAQVGRGLYGALIVEDPADPKAFGDDLVLMLSDMGLDEHGELLPADSGGNFGDLFGREGRRPARQRQGAPTLEGPHRQAATLAHHQRDARALLQLRLRNHRFIRLGGDNGLAARSEDVYNLISRRASARTPCSRRPIAPGSHGPALVPVDRGYGQHVQPRRRRHAAIETVAEPRGHAGADPGSAAHDRAARRRGATSTRSTHDRARRRSVEMGINGVPYWKASPCEARSARRRSGASRTTRTSPTRSTCTATSSRCSTTRACPEWKDTVNVPAKSELRIAVHFDERPGMWMYPLPHPRPRRGRHDGALVVRDPNAPPPAALTPALPAHHQRAAELSLRPMARIPRPRRGCHRDRGNRWIAACRRHPGVARAPLRSDIREGLEMREHVVERCGGDQAEIARSRTSAVAPWSASPCCDPAD